MNFDACQSLTRRLRPHSGKRGLVSLAAFLFIWNITYTPLHLVADHGPGSVNSASSQMVDSADGLSVTSDSNTGKDAPSSGQRSGHSKGHGIHDHLAAIYAIGHADAPVLCYRIESKSPPVPYVVGASVLPIGTARSRAPPAVCL
jgi:hypothetical protein